MIKLRVGMDINLNYSIMRDDAPENLNNADNISVKLAHTQSKSWQLPINYKLVGDNTLQIKVKGGDIIKLGIYRLIIAYTKYNPNRDPHNEPFIMDCTAFDIVPYSDMVVESTLDSKISVNEVNLTGIIDKCQDGNDGAIPEIGENGNWWIKGLDTGLPTRGIQGLQGTQGTRGLQGVKGLKGDRGDAFVYEDFTPTQIADIKKHALDAAQIANTATVNANIATTNATNIVALVEALSSTITDGYNVQQSLISPMQGSYTGITTPKQDNSVKWTGNLAPIASDDFMIEVACGFENSKLSSNPAFLIGTTNLANGIYPYKSTDNNELSIITFYGNNITINKTKPNGKIFHVVVGRNGVNAWVMVNGVVSNVTTSVIHDIARNITVSNASNFALLRKFNFANEAFAKSLYNGGRWSEVVIGEEYLNPNLLYSSDFISDTDNWGASWSGNEGSLSSWNSKLKVAFNSGTTASFQRPALFRTITSNAKGSFKIKIKFKIESTVSTIKLNAITYFSPHAHVGASPDSNGYINITLNCNNKVENRNVLTLYFDTTGFTPSDYFLISDFVVQEIGVQNEFKCENICDNGMWLDTVDIGNKLVATNNDKIIYNTAPQLQDKLFGTGAPTFTPDAIGQEYYDTVGKVKYSAFGTATLADWVSQ